MMQMQTQPQQMEPMTTDAAPAPVLPQGAVSQPPPLQRKRKAETQDNERLSKRLSLLNLEHGGSKLYVPVETPSVKSAEGASQQSPSDSMQLDDSKHKVYIYNIDDELSSESEDEEGKLVFLPDIEKHLRQNRIPPHVLANSDGELAGMQLVLYSDPKSLSIPEEKDSVRKAIIEARQRARENQSLQLEGATISNQAVVDKGGDEAMDTD